MQDRKYQQGQADRLAGLISRSNNGRYLDGYYSVNPSRVQWVGQRPQLPRKSKKT